MASEDIEGSEFVHRAGKLDGIAPNRQVFKASVLHRIRFAESQISNFRLQ